MNTDLHKVVKFVNKTDFDFNDALGAKYDGRPFFVKAGESIMLPYVIGKHLATALAKQILLKRAEETAKSNVTTALWDQRELDRVATTLIENEYAEEKVNPKSDTDLLMEKVAELNKFEEKEVADVSYQTKADIIEELRKREIKFDARKSKAELEKLLTE